MWELSQAGSAPLVEVCVQVSGMRKLGKGHQIGTDISHVIGSAVTLQVAVAFTGLDSLFPPLKHKVT